MLDLARRLSGFPGTGGLVGSRCIAGYLGGYWSLAGCVSARVGLGTTGIWSGGECHQHARGDAGGGNRRGRHVDVQQGVADQERWKLRVSCVNEWVEPCVGPHREGVLESGAIRTRYKKNQNRTIHKAETSSSSHRLLLLSSQFQSLIHISFPSVVLTVKKPNEGLCG